MFPVALQTKRQAYPQPLPMNGQQMRLPLHLLTVARMHHEYLVPTPSSAVYQSPIDGSEHLLQPVGSHHQYPFHLAGYKCADLHRSAPENH